MQTHAEVVSIVPGNTHRFLTLLWKANNCSFTSKGADGVHSYKCWRDVDPTPLGQRWIKMLILHSVNAFILYWCTTNACILWLLVLFLFLHRWYPPLPPPTPHVCSVTHLTITPTVVYLPFCSWYRNLIIVVREDNSAMIWYNRGPV